MFYLIRQNCVNIMRQHALKKRQDANYHLVGIIPGGGLGKLQSITEEEYCSRQDKNSLKHIKEKLEADPNATSDLNIPEEPSMVKVLDSTSSLRQKNPLEEGYFLNEHSDCLKLLKLKNS